MKKKYQQPLIKVLTVENESLLNGGSIVKSNGETVNKMGSTTGGTEGEGGTVWGDAKPYNPWTTWD